MVIEIEELKKEISALEVTKIEWDSGQHDDKDVPSNAAVDIIDQNKDVMELEQQLLNLNQDTDIAFPGLVASRISELDSIRTEIESYKRRSLKATSISASKKDSLKPRHISTNLNTKLSKKQSKGVARPKSKPARDDSMDWFTDVGAAYCIAP